MLIVHLTSSAALTMACPISGLICPNDMFAKQALYMKETKGEKIIRERERESVCVYIV